MAVIHNLSFRGDKLFDSIIDGRKTVEGRRHIKNIVVGDLIRMTCGNRWVICIVEYIHKYDNVIEYLKAEGVDRAVPGATFDEALTLYESFGVNRTETFYGIGIKLMLKSINCVANLNHHNL